MNDEKIYYCDCCGFESSDPSFITRYPISPYIKQRVNQEHNFCNICASTMISTWFEYRAEPTMLEAMQQIAFLFNRIEQKLK